MYQANQLPPATYVKGMGSIDLSNLTWDNYLLFGIGAMMLYAIISPGASIFTPSNPKPKKRRKKVSAGAGFAGGAVTVLILAAGGYLAYSYLSSTPAQEMP